jgi:hypothetical protein
MIYKNWLVDVRVDSKLVVGDRLGEFFLWERRRYFEELLEEAGYFEKT